MPVSHHSRIHICNKERMNVNVLIFSHLLFVPYHVNGRTIYLAFFCGKSVTTL